MVYFTTRIEITVVFHINDYLWITNKTTTTWTTTKAARRCQQKVVKQLEQQQHQQFQHIQTQTRQQQQQQFHQQITMTDEMRLAQEAQLAKLSVRLKVQRFESSGPPPINYIGQVSVSQSGSPRQSGMQTPTHVALTGRNKPTQVLSAPPVTPVAKPSEVRLVSNTKENSAPVPLPAKSMVMPRMMEQTYQNESTPLLPKTTVAASHIQSPIVIQQQPASQVLDPFSGVQLRQPAISKFQIELKWRRWMLHVLHSFIGKTLINSNDLDSSLNRRSLADYTNYNTAPRGWTSAAQEIYRPVTFKMAWRKRRNLFHCSSLYEM